MFLACLECFAVVGERSPIADASVVPVICPACTKRSDDKLSSRKGKHRDLFLTTSGIRDRFGIVYSDYGDLVVLPLSEN